MYMFSIRPIWLELNIPTEYLYDRFRFYFGSMTRSITDRDEAICLLREIVSKIQFNMVQRFTSHNVKEDIKALYKILDEVYRLYIAQKEARNELMKLNVSDDQFEQSKNIAINILDATNLWIENCLLYQQQSDEEYDCTSFDLDHDLLITMYVYGFASRALSLLMLSCKFDDEEKYTGDNRLFYGLKLNPDTFYPAEILKYHPVVYFNTILAGNQNTLSVADDLGKADDQPFGKGFYLTYGVEFINSLRMMSTFEHTLLYDGKYAFTVIDKQDFIDVITAYSQGIVDAQCYYDAFVLTHERIDSQKKKVSDPIIWIGSTNKYRHELRPFLCLDDESVYISYTALEQAKNMWASLYLNGGMCYSNAKDNLTAAIEKRNDELSVCLVDRLRDILRKHYTPSFDEIDVRYDRIFGVKPDDYGDYDIVFFSAETNELYLIEAKFMSDSWNNSGIITDYEKMFKKGGYYEHCRHRYDLVIQEADKIKAFIGASGIIDVHFLFLTSKPLEIEFQDEDKMVTFVCLSIFDKYIEGKLESEDGKEIVRPTRKI